MQGGKIIYSMKKCIKIILVTVMILILLQLYNSTVFAVVIEPEINDVVELVRENCYFKGDTLMIPFRAFWETFGADVDWDNINHTAKAYYESDICKFEISVFMGEKPQVINIWDKKITPDITAILNNGEKLFAYSDSLARADMIIIINSRSFPVFFNIPAEIINDRLYFSANILTNQFYAYIVYDWYKISVKFTDNNIIEMANREIEKDGIINLINAERIENGLNPLKQAVNIDKVCHIKSADKSIYKYFGHYSPKLGTPSVMFDKYITGYKFTGECLYYCNIKVPYARVFEAWMNSPGHKNIILNKDSEYIGINMITDENGGVYWTLLTAV